MSISNQSLLRMEACKILGISQAASPGEARAAFLKQLAECDFNPASLGRESAAELGILSVVSRENIHEHAEENLRERINHFAHQEFWTLSTIDRKAKWNNLLEWASSYPKQRARLQDLEAGLEIDTPRPGEPEEIELVQIILNRFGTSLLERANHQNCDVSLLNKEIAESISRQYPELIQIDQLSRSNLLNENTYYRKQIFDSDTIFGAPEKRPDYWMTFAFVSILIMITCVIAESVSDQSKNNQSNSDQITDNQSKNKMILDIFKHLEEERLKKLIENFKKQSDTK